MYFINFKENIIIILFAWQKAETDNVPRSKLKGKPVQISKDTYIMLQSH